MEVLEVDKSATLVNEVDADEWQITYTSPAFNVPLNESPEDQLPETWAPFFDAMQQLYLPYLLKNREALALAKDHVDMDYGFGLVQTPVRIYQELSRMNLRDEIVRLPAPDLARVKSAIPEGVIAAYLAAPLDDVPELTGNKDTFPDPRGIGTLDNV